MITLSSFLAIVFHLMAAEVSAHAELVTFQDYCESRSISDSAKISVNAILEASETTDCAKVEDILIGAKILTINAEKIDLLVFSTSAAKVKELRIKGVIQNQDEISKFRFLQFLTIDGAALNLKLLADLKFLKALHILGLQEPDLLSLPEGLAINDLAIASSPRLRKLDGIESLISLERLELNKTRISDLALLTKLPLKRLGLVDCLLEDLAPLNEIEQLLVFNVENNYLTSLESIKNHPSLESLSANQNYLTQTEASCPTSGKNEAVTTYCAKFKKLNAEELKKVAR